MKQSRLLEFITQWKSIEKRRKDLDYEECRWCAALRAEFPNGKAGDNGFAKWLSVELGLPPERREECLSRARSHTIVPDRQQWEALGGYVQIRKLEPLDKRERVAVIGAVMATGYRIATVVRQRESKAVAPQRTPDVVVLAEFVEQLDAAPDDVREVARRHVRAKALRVVA